MGDYAVHERSLLPGGGIARTDSGLTIHPTKGCSITQNGARVTCETDEVEQQVLGKHAKAAVASAKVPSTYTRVRDGFSEGLNVLSMKVGTLRERCIVRQAIAEQKDMYGTSYRSHVDAEKKKKIVEISTEFGREKGNVKGLFYGKYSIGFDKEHGKNKEIKINSSSIFSKAEFEAAYAVVEKAEALDKEGEAVSTSKLKSEFKELRKETIISNRLREASHLKNLYKEITPPLEVSWKGKFEKRANKLVAVTKEDYYKDESFRPGVVDIEKGKELLIERLFDCLKERKEHVRFLEKQSMQIPQLVEWMAEIAEGVRSVMHHEIFTDNDKARKKLGKIVQDMDSRVRLQSVAYLSKTMPGHPAPDELEKIGNPLHILAIAHDTYGIDRAESMQSIFNTLATDKLCHYPEHHPLLEKNSDGLNPLHLAAKTMNLEFISTLFRPFASVESGKTYQLREVISQSNNGPHGESPAHFLVQNFENPKYKKDPGSISLMLYFIATSCPEMLRLKNDEGKTPFDIAKQLMNEKGIDMPQEALFYLEHPEAAQNLIKDHVDATNTYVSACLNNKTDGLEQQVKDIQTRIGTLKQEVKGIEERVNKKIKTPEDKARLPEIVKELKEEFDTLADYLPAPGDHKSESDAYTRAVKEYEGGKKNPLYALAGDVHKGHKEIIPYMDHKSAKASLVKKNSSHQTPIDVAIKSGNLPFLQILFGARKHDDIVDLAQCSKWKDGCILKRAIDALVEAKDSEEIGRFSEVVTLIGGAALNANDLPVITTYIDEKIRLSTSDALKVALGNVKERLPTLPVERQLQKSIIAHKTIMLVIREQEKLEKSTLKSLKRQLD